MLVNADRIWGNFIGLYGDASNIEGNITDMNGDLTEIKGNSSQIQSHAKDLSFLGISDLDELLDGFEIPLGYMVSIYKSIPDIFNFKVGFRSKKSILKMKFKYFPIADKETNIANIRNFIKEYLEEYENDQI